MINSTEVLTLRMKTVYLHAEINPKEEEADDGEEVDEKNGQNSCQNN